MPVFTAGSASVSIVPDFTGAQEKIDAWFARQGDVKVGVRPDVDTVALAGVRTEIEAGAGNAKVKVGVDQNFLTNSLSVSVTQAVSSLTGLSAMGAIIQNLVGPTLVTSVGGALVAIAGAASQAAGALALLPAGFAALAAPISAVIVGVQGMSEAFKAAASGDPQKLAAAMANLAPAAQDFVTQALALKPALTDLRLDVQQQLFSGLGDTVTAVAAQALPVFQAGLAGVAGALNTGMLSALRTVGAEASNFGLIFGNLTTTWGILAQAASPIISALTTIGVIGSQYLPQLATGALNAANAFNQWATEAAKSGQLASIIQNAIGAISQLGSIVGNVAGIIGGLFEAAIPSGRVLLTVVDTLTAQLSLFVHSAEGQTALAGFFQSVAAAATSLQGPLTALITALLSGLLPVIGQLAAALAPVVGQLMTQLASVIMQVTSVTPPLAAVIASLFSAFAPLIPVLGQLITSLLPPLITIAGQLAPIISQLSAIIGQALLGAVQAITPILPLIGTAFVQILQALLPVLPALTQLALQLLPPLLQIVVALLPVLVSAAGAFAAMTTAVAGPLGGALAAIANTLAAILVPVLGVMADHINIVIAAIGVWEGVSLAMAAVNAVQMAGGIDGLIVKLALWVGQLGIVKLATEAWTAVQWLLNVALDANPIGIVVLALGLLVTAVTLAWQNSETFRTIIIGAWTAIQAAAVSIFQNFLVPLWSTLSAAWSAFASAVATAANAVIQPVWAALQVAAAALGAFWNATWSAAKAAWDALAAGVQVAWTSVIQPVWNAIDVAARVLLAVLATVVFAPILIAWNVMSAGIQLGYQTIIQPTWNLLQAAAGALWSFLQVTWAAMQAAWSALATAWRAVYDAVIQPMWNALQAAMGALQAFLAASWTALQAAWSVLGAAWRAVYDSVIVPMWNALQAAMAALQAFLAASWSALQAAWSALGAAWRAIYDSVIQPMWNAMQTGMNALWNGVLQPIWTAMQALWDTVMRAMRSVYDSVIAPMWTIFTSAIQGVQSTFETVVGGIQTAWDRLKGIAAAPINFVIDTVLNNGLIKAWNDVVGWLGLSNLAMGTLATIPTAAAGGQAQQVLAMADGGEIPGTYLGPTADNVLAMVGNTPLRVNPREWIHPVAAVDYYGADKMAALQTRAISRDALDLAIAMTPGMAAGGLVGLNSIPALPPGSFVVNDHVAGLTRNFLEALNSGQTEALQAAGGPNAVMHQRFAAGGMVPAAKDWVAQQVGKPYVWGAVGPSGYDCSGFQSALTNVLRGAANPYSRLGSTATFPWSGFTSGYGTYTIGSTPDAGGGVGHMAGTLDGLNVESQGTLGVVSGGAARGADNGLFTTRAFLPETGGVFVSGGATTGGAAPAPKLGGILGSVAETLTYLTDGIKTVGDMAGQFGDSPFLQAVTAVPKKLLDSAWGVIKDQVAQWFTTFAANVTGSGVTPTGGTQALKDQAFTIGNSFGFTSQAQHDATDYIVSHESGWNPTAQNPTSTASGLWQQIDATWAANRPNTASQYAHMKDAPTDLQDYAGFSYIQGRYGDPVAAQAYWAAHGNYAQGGQVLNRDTGGPIPPGYSTIFNGTGRTETAVNASQTDRLLRLASRGRLGGADGDGQAPVWHFYLGDREITEMIDARVSYHSDADARHMRSGAL